MMFARVRLSGCGGSHLAAVPSGLVIAVTAYLTTDVAAAPFLWVVPLAIYLLTFVAVFRDRPWIAHANVVRFVPFAVAPLAVSLIGGEKVFWVTTIALNLVAFALLTLMCHGELYARRPSPRRLTEFYLCTSFGGVIGGAFAGLVAPQIFNGNYEYPILIALALLCTPGIFAGGVAQGVGGSMAVARAQRGGGAGLVSSPGFSRRACWNCRFKSCWR